MHSNRKSAAAAAESIRRIHTHIPVNCTVNNCPLFKSCAKIPTQLLARGEKNPKVLFLFEGVGHDEVEQGMPSAGSSGMYFRDHVLSPLLKRDPFSYAISSAVRGRGVAEDEDSEPDEVPERAKDLCAEHHLRQELLNLRPSLVVAYGAGAFEALVHVSRNKHELPDFEVRKKPTVTALRRPEPYRLQITEDYTQEVLVCYSPSYGFRNPGASRLVENDTQRVLNILKPGTFTSAQLRGSSGSSDAKLEVKQVQVLTTVPEVLDYLNFLQHDLKEPTVVAFDTETEGLHRKFNNKFLSWQFCHAEGHGVAFPIDHPEAPLFSGREDKLKLIEAAQSLFNRRHKNLEWFVAHNAKFDLGALYGLMGILPRSLEESTPWWCTMLAMHWLDENRKELATALDGRPYSLKTLGKEFFGFAFNKEQLAARGDGDLVRLSLKDLFEYGCSDVILTRALYYEQLRQAEQQPDKARQKLENFSRHYFWPASRSLAMVECNGIYVNRTHLEHLQGPDSPLLTRMEEIERNELPNSPEMLDFRRKYAEELRESDPTLGGVFGKKLDYALNPWDDEDEEQIEEELPTYRMKVRRHQELLYLDFLDMEPLSVSKKTGAPSFDKEYLKYYADPDNYINLPGVQPYRSRYQVENPPKNPLQLILEFREMATLSSTFIKSMEARIVDEYGDSLDSRIRPTFNIAGTDTGRLSSSEPNLQNIPKGKTKDAKATRNIFQSEPPSKRFPEGTALIQMDYKTAEVRWAAIFANDQSLIKVFNEATSTATRARADSTLTDDEFKTAMLAADLHKRTASLMFGVPAESVDDSMRNSSKAITFGLMYGQAAATLSARNGWSEEEGEEKLEKFFSAFPRLRKWLENNPKIAETRGYVETLMGRRRRLSHYFSAKNPRHIGDGSRRAMNAPIQGQSSDGCTIGLIGFTQYLLDHKLEKKWLIETIVHDAILVQVPVPDLKQALQVMEQCFVKGMKSYIEDHWGVKLPLEIEGEFEIGLKYGDLNKWDGRPHTLDKLLDELKGNAAKEWRPLSEPLVAKRPSPKLDLVHWEGGR